MWVEIAIAFAAGVAIAFVTTPVGVSGAVFLLPVQVSVLGVPSPAVTPTNLMYNVISVPGALARYRRQASLRSRLTTRLVTGTLPGVVAGAVVRVFVVPDGTVFRLLVALLLLPLGVWLLVRDRMGRPAEGGHLPAAALLLLGLAAGFAGGIYGIGGGAVVAPILVGLGYPVAQVAPAALVSTFLTSCAGAATYVVIAAAGHGQASPAWALGICAGLGGLVGGFVGAGLQPRLPARVLTVGLGVTAIALAVAYLVVVVAAR